MMVGEMGGCAVFSCPPGLLPFIIGVFEESELTDVAVPGVPTFGAQPPSSVADLGVRTVIDYFGLFCENNKLMASIYPRGIAIGFSLVGADGSLNGKKAPATSMLW
ncbi:Glutaminase [Caenorhabditis elegans]|uniref:Glutaminase n=1 Tax=Caenorhabditis elegans TaxID=6239 RepID=O76599_CAEEL|nr:Glutaminase [Caenorhabditis elegans]CCD69613.1 Glutaminase [Caenorhabditis elegans]|eukprot:NP_494268.2 Uncharacterized protein CELE_F16G10.1 [Caenorhabditis elegans]